MKFKIGDSACFEKTISESDVYTYAGLTGDFNPLHINKVVAEKSIFKGQIVHGLLVSGLISTVIGTQLPGFGTVYMSQEVKFLRPVRFGDTVKATVTLAEVINIEKGIYKLKTIVTNQDDVLVIDGFAVVKYTE